MVTTQLPDLYALLQVPHEATTEQIEAAYARFEALYSAERLQTAPPEFQQLGARRREELAHAFAVLHDPEQRAAYDRERTPRAVSTSLDFRPLPPARGRERPSPSVPLPPVRPVQREVQPRLGARGRRSPIMPLVVGSMVLAVLLTLVLSGVRVQGGAGALATPAIPDLVLPYSDARVAEARARAEEADDAATWSALGNVLYDNLMTMRERAPLSPQYLASVPQWLDVAQAYRQALERGAGPAARADLAVALYYHGTGLHVPESITQAIDEVERARANGPDDPRVLLNYGLIMASVEPPRRAEALAAWRRVVLVAPDAYEAGLARDLLAQYGTETP